MHMPVMQLEAMEAARLQDANAAQDEIAASEKAKQELQNQLEEAQQLLRQQQAEIRALKTKTPQNIGHSSSLCRGIPMFTYGSFCTSQIIRRKDYIFGV